MGALLKAKKLVWTPCKLKRFRLESDKFQQTSEKSALAKYRDESSLFYSKGLFALWFIWPCGLAGHLPPCSPRQILLKEILSIATNVLALQRIVLTHTRAMQTKCTTGFASTKDISELSSVLWNSVLSSPRRLNHKVVQPPKVISTSFLAFSSEAAFEHTKKTKNDSRSTLH